MRDFFYGLITVLWIIGMGAMYFMISKAYQETMGLYLPLLFLIWLIMTAFLQEVGND